MKQLLIALALTSTSVYAAPPVDFDTRVEALRKAVGVPGVGIAIVEKGQTVLAK